MLRDKLIQLAAEINILRAYDIDGTQPYNQFISARHHRIISTATQTQATHVRNSLKLFGYCLVLVRRALGSKFSIIYLDKINVTSNKIALYDESVMLLETLFTFML